MLQCSFIQLELSSRSRRSPLLLILLLTRKKIAIYTHTHIFTYATIFFLLFSCFLFVNSIQPNAQLHMRIYIVCDNQYLCGLFIYYYYFSHFVSCLFNIKLIWLLLEIFSFSRFPIASLFVNTHTNIEGIKVVKCRSKNK